MGDAVSLVGALHRGSVKVRELPLGLDVLTGATVKGPLPALSAPSFLPDEGWRMEEGSSQGPCVCLKL